MEFMHVAAAQPVLALRQHHDAASFRRFIGQRSQLGGVGQCGHGHAFGRQKLHGLAVSQRDGARLVQEQHVHVAGGFHRPARHGNHVGLNHPIHSGDADGRKQPADRCGNETDQQGHEHRDRDGRAATGRLDAEQRERQQSHADQQEDDASCRPTECSRRFRWAFFGVWPLRPSQSCDPRKFRRDRR